MNFNWSGLFTGALPLVGTIVLLHTFNGVPQQTPPGASRQVTIAAATESPNLPHRGSGRIS